MIAALNPRFAKCVALMRGSSHQGERDAARGRASKIAAGMGMSLDEALRLHDAKPDEPAKPAKPRAWWEDLDDAMEAREPGFKARRAAEKAARATARRQRAAEAIKRYGSKEAALAPCWREQALRMALRPWATMCKPPHQRWTDKLNGYEFMTGAAEHLKQAVRHAYPLPSTFREAMAEHAYWEGRRREIEDVLDDDMGEDLLDLTAKLRADMVRDLVETDIAIADLTDLRDRLAIIVDQGHSNRDAVRAAVFRDLNAMVEAKAKEDAEPATRAADLSTPGQIEALLRREPQASDRSIARQAGCSPTTVGKIRRVLGLANGPRSVHRRGQTYSMKCPRGQMTADMAREDRP